ncbi:MAG: UDP-2,3-diacylglucosamine diphosphatase [Sterolibacterium sp.]|nr:UDP-2,3-diacylglucosamine diphosphatase [Sterolibacterium sp.]
MPQAPILLISDLHLCPQQPEIAALFLGFLDQPIVKNAAALYILGDLFEAWAGDDDLADTFNRRICDALLHCSASTAIYFIAGNRDFLIGQDFAHASGVQLLDEPRLLDLGGVTTLLMHGDTLCSDDRAYQDFRTMVRNPDWQRSFLARPLAERKAQIAALRQRSEAEKQDKPALIMDVNENTVANTLRSHGYPRLIHGHTHRQGSHTHWIDGQPCQRWVLGDWHHDGNYLLIDEHGHCQFHTLPCS